MSTLREVGEIALLDRLASLFTTNKSLAIGPGDDCAVVRNNTEWDTLLKTDAIVENIHFLPTTKPCLIGRKALARNISDIAAMGGIPEHALVTLLVHPDRPIEFIENIYQGISDLAKQWNISIAGGETSSLPYDGLIISIALFGKVPHNTSILRSTANHGDLIVVTGELGNTFKSDHHLCFTPRVKEGTVLRESGIVSSMMDISDGLITDIKRLSKASGLNFNLELEKIPRRNNCSLHSALSEGEDYELLFSIPKKNINKLNKIQQSLLKNTKLTVIGNFTSPNEPSTQIDVQGWQHFINS